MKLFKARLRPSLPHLAGEAPASFVSRLAQLHLGRDASAPFFCADMGLDFRGIIDGDQDAVDALASLAGVDPDRLAADAFRRVPDGQTFRGELFPGRHLLRTALRVCPACLLEDCAQASKPETAAYGRALWSIAAIKTCRKHGMALVKLEHQETSRNHDFARLLKPHLPDLGALSERATCRTASSLETYVLDRLDEGRGNIHWLDTLPLHVGIGVCETIGAVARFGRDVRFNTLSDDDWCAAGTTGIAIAEKGEVGIREFMDGLVCSYPYTRSATEGPQAVLGRWFKVLSFEKLHPDFDVVRDLVAEFIAERMPFGPGDTIFGKPVQRRVLHSVYTASQELRIHPKRLRKILHATRILTKEQAELPNGSALFDAVAASPTLADAADGLFMTEVKEYLGAGRVQTKLLVDGGFIKPMLPKRPELDHLFRRRDLDTFLTRLFADAVPVAEPDEDMVDIQRAVKKVCCSTAEILDLVLGRKLAWVGRRRDAHGFSALLVRVSEVRDRTRGSMDGCTTARAVEKVMRTNSAVVRKLIDLGFLQTTTIVSPLNRCPVNVIREADLEAFRAEHVTLFEAMATTGIHFRQIQKRLTALGIEPQIRREEVGAAFYRRSDLARI